MVVVVVVVVSLTTTTELDKEVLVGVVVIGDREGLEVVAVIGATRHTGLLLLLLDIKILKALGLLLL